MRPPAVTVLPRLNVNVKQDWRSPAPQHFVHIGNTKDAGWVISRIPTATCETRHCTGQSQCSRRDRTLVANPTRILPRGAGLEHHIDKRRQRRTLGQDEQRPYEEHHDDDRKESPLLPDVQEAPELLSKLV
jgi:hypothetical protein